MARPDLPGPPYVGVKRLLMANILNSIQVLKLGVVGKSGKLSTKKEGFQQFSTSYPHMKISHMLTIGIYAQYFCGKYKNRLSRYGGDKYPNSYVFVLELLLPG